MNFCVTPAWLAKETCRLVENISNHERRRVVVWCYDTPCDVEWAEAAYDNAEQQNPVSFGFTWNEWISLFKMPTEELQEYLRVFVNDWWDRTYGVNLIFKNSKRAWDGDL